MHNKVTIDTKKVTPVTITLKVGKWDNGIRVGISEKMKVGANDSSKMLINLTYILYSFTLPSSNTTNSHFPINYHLIVQAFSLHHQRVTEAKSDLSRTQRPVSSA